MVVLNLCQAYGIAYVSGHVVNIIYVFVHYVLVCLLVFYMWSQPTGTNKMLVLYYLYIFLQ